jgi:hypothetical protein
MKKSILLPANWIYLSTLRHDLIITLLIFLFAVFWGGRFVTSGIIQPLFDQVLYAPAVMEACGKGFIVPATHQQASEIPGLLDFLQQKQTSFDCKQLPSQFKQKAPIAYQNFERYLMGAVALIWKLTGVSWNSLTPLHALLFGLSNVAVYGVFRLSMSKPLAMALAISQILSSLQLSYLPHLRDYSKAPFIIATTLLLSWMVKYSFSREKTVLLSLITGAWLGLGLGFRTDLLVFIPAALITLAAFTPNGYNRDGITRFLAIAVFILSFLLVGWPILSMSGESGSLFHLILLGLMEPFDGKLGVRPSDVYEWGYLYHDWYVKAFLDSFAQRILGINFDRPHLILVDAPKEYDQVARLYYLEILRNFPADFASRFLAAALRVLQMPFNAAPLMGIIGLILIIAHNMRLGVFATIAVIYLCGYPSLQFGTRHYFHLQFVSLFLLGTLCQLIFNRLHVVFADFRKDKILSSHGLFNEVSYIKYKQGVITISAFILVISASLFFLRRLQQDHLQIFLQPYAQLSSNSDKFTPHSIGNDMVRLVTTEMIDWSEGRKNLIEYDYLLRTDYWILKLDGRSCNKDSISISIHYNSDNPRKDYSRITVLDIKEPIRYIFHTYSLSPSFFDGLDIEKESLDCVKSFGRAIDFEKLPLLMNIILKDNWENTKLYQSINLYKNE